MAWPSDRMAPLPARRKTSAAAMMMPSAIRNRRIVLLPIRHLAARSREPAQHDSAEPETFLNVTGTNAVIEANGPPWCDRTDATLKDAEGTVKTTGTSNRTGDRLRSSLRSSPGTGRVDNGKAMQKSLVPILLVLFAATSARGQNAPSITLPTVIVTAQKEQADVRTVPASVTAVTSDTLKDADIRIVSEAAVYSPNTWFSEFSARKLSNARMRGVGSSPANPGITTYVDGVPMMHANASSVELLDVGQLEFVRGPQSPLFGRNTLGGLINVTSAKPGLDRWRGSVIAPFGDFSSREVRGSVSGPLGDRAAVAFAGGTQQRDGFTVNSLTGHDVDFRDGTFGKIQFLLLPSQNWEARVIVSSERDRDGDYALSDLAAARSNPFAVARDFEGYTNRDVTSTAVLLRGDGERVSLTSSTGFVGWSTEDATDLDYSPLPLATRTNAEDARQFTQEIRLSSPANAPAQLSDALMLRWQAGVTFFTQNYDQLAVNTIAPFVLSPLVPVPVALTSPQAALDDAGVGVFGQATLIVNDTVDMTFGARFDHESKEAAIDTFSAPALTPRASVDADRSFTDVSPQFSLSYRFQQNHMLYGAVSRGFKAGGFNPVAVPGQEAYGEEHALHTEGGFKSTLAGGKASLDIAAFFIDWNDMQLNVPIPLAPGQFYIANVGEAASRGLEVDVAARPHAHIDLFGSLGYTHATFGNGTRSGGVDVSGHAIPNTPEYTATVGTQVGRPLSGSWSAYARVEGVFYGALHYDEANTQGQDAYGLANLRGGVRGRWLTIDAWIRNAFDTRYVPVAFPYQGFAPSGFIGEPGRPRTFGVSVGATF
jgi:iron complex outermembrane receptor protein